MCVRVFVCVQTIHLGKCIIEIMQRNVSVPKNSIPTKRPLDVEQDKQRSRHLMNVKLCNWVSKFKMLDSKTDPWARPRLPEFCLDCFSLTTEGIVLFFI